MYSIVRTDYGLHITMGGQYAPEEIKTYLVEKEAFLDTIVGPYSVLVDLRSAIPAHDADEHLLAQSQRKMSQNNLVRMAIIVISPVLEVQGRQVILSAGVGDRTRIINANKTRSWETAALDWIVNGVEPNASGSKSDAGPDPGQFLGTFSRKL